MYNEFWNYSYIITATPLGANEWIHSSIVMRRASVYVFLQVKVCLMITILTFRNIGSRISILIFDIKLYIVPFNCFTVHSKLDVKPTPLNKRCLATSPYLSKWLPSLSLQASTSNCSNTRRTQMVTYHILTSLWDDTRSYVNRYSHFNHYMKCTDCLTFYTYSINRKIIMNARIWNINLLQKNSALL